MVYFLCTETHYHSLYIVSDEFSTHPAEIVIQKDNDPTDVLVAPVDGFKSREERAEKVYLLLYSSQRAEDTAWHPQEG